MDVYLAEKCSQGPAEKLGVFSTRAIAEGIRQNSANECLGAASTPPLTWLHADDMSHGSASYHHLCDGMWLFQVTRYTVDEAREDTS